MSRRLLLLGGIAILAVVFMHSAGWGEVAMFWWVDRYRAATPPNFDQLNSLSYWLLMLMFYLPIFSVPAFMFVTGYFVGYSARGGGMGLSWKAIRTRLMYLLVPYLIWSGILFVGDALQGNAYPPAEYLLRLLTGKASAPYFYVPVICQFYLLSPFLIRLAKTRPKLLLIAAAVLQLGAILVRYPENYDVTFPGLSLMLNLTQGWMITAWLFFLAFGLIISLHGRQFVPKLARFRWPLLFLLVLFASLNLLEGEMMSRFIGLGTRWVGPLTITGSLYAVAFILCYLSFDKLTVPLSSFFHELGRKTYGIYLLHYAVLEFSARVIRQIVPHLLAYQVLFALVLVSLGAGLPLLFMIAVSKSPLRRYYRYLFG